MANGTPNPFDRFLTNITIGGQQYRYYPLDIVAKEYFGRTITLLPVSIRILLENAIRHGDEKGAQEIINWQDKKSVGREIAFRPARVLLQDFTGVPAIADLAAMRDAMKKQGRDPALINPRIPVDLVIDHSVTVNDFGSDQSLGNNIAIEFEQNNERYQFLKWGQGSFRNLRIVPPGTGICHQVNIEYLSQVVMAQDGLLFPDTLVGTDSHTTMANGLGILGFGVGGIEAEAAMLGQPIPLTLPDVVGVKLTGNLAVGVTATDLALSVTELLRKKNVVGKLVEFFGDGIEHLSLSDRATIGNMAPEYGATVGLFPIDNITLLYLRETARPQDVIDRVELYAKAVGLWHNSTTPTTAFSDILELPLASVVPCMAGPKRPQDRVPLSEVKKVNLALDDKLNQQSNPHDPHHNPKGEMIAQTMPQHAVVLAAITSCTNTSNPFVMLAAGLVAKKAVELGLQVQPWVKTSLAPGSRVVQDYLERAGLLSYLEQLGFNIVGFGCTTCIGNSGPLKNAAIEEEIKLRNLTVSAVLSGNRNFEGRIHPLVKSNWLASPPLVVAYALLGSTGRDITTEPLGTSNQGDPIYLRDLWPNNKTIVAAMEQFINPSIYHERYSHVFDGPASWQSITPSSSSTFAWQDSSTYIKQPPFFQLTLPDRPAVLQGMKLLALLGDSITTDHISPAGSIKADSPAGKYLTAAGIATKDFNSYGARRGNHEVMVRGTFGNIRLKNQLVSVVGGFSLYDGQLTPLFDAAMKYKQTNTPLLVIAGREYGTGSSRDWAAKGVRLLGVSAVLAISFERIHRSNLVGMGVLPLEFVDPADRDRLNLHGDESFALSGFDTLGPDHTAMTLTIAYPQQRPEQGPASGTKKDLAKQPHKLSIKLRARIDNNTEMQYFKAGGVLPFMLNQIAV